MKGQQITTHNSQIFLKHKEWSIDILIRKISLDPIGLHGQGAIANYIPKFQVTTMSLEVA